MKIDPNKTLEEAQKILSQRNAIYKNNYGPYGKVMESLFPEGVELKTARDHIRFHLFVLLIVKITRYTNNYNIGGEQDSLIDAINYLAFLREVDAFPRQLKDALNEK